MCRPRKSGQKKAAARLRDAAADGTRLVQFGICTVLLTAVKLIASPAGGANWIGGKLAVVIGGAAPGVPPRGVGRTTCDGGRGAPLRRWFHIRLSAWLS